MGDSYNPQILGQSNAFHVGNKPNIENATGMNVSLRM